uniref:Uncharacterized protein n=1 Tax=Kalanchoe fedtschenkoi TaxID=63787 RepID=A0A7N0VLJ6_KALFE
MDETWKLSKGRSRSSTSRSSSSSKDYYSKQQYPQAPEAHLVKSYSQRPSTSSNRSPPLLTKSFSQRGSSSSSSKQASWANNGRNSYGDSDLMRSGSQKGSSSSSNNSIGKKCGSLAREQKARFYIMRRCVAMLVCWHEQVDES